MTTSEMDTIAKLVEATQKEMAAILATNIYADNPLLKKAKPPTRWERVKEFFSRAKDAWLVLTGKLDPYDSW